MSNLKTVQKCKDCTKEFLIIDQEARFYSDKGLPNPDQCPACRHKFRMALRNERALYKRTCACCGDSILATYPEEAPYKVYCQKCFWENIG